MITHLAQGSRSHSWVVYGQPWRTKADGYFELVLFYRGRDGRAGIRKGAK